MRTQWIQHVPPVLALQRNDFTTCTPDVRIDIESLPEMINRRRTRHGTHVEKYADVGLQDRTEGIEEPAMRVNFLLILLLEAEDELHRHNILFVTLNLLRRRDRN